MSINSSSIGDNTVQISTSGGTFAEFLTAVTDAITGTNPIKTTGWSLYDQVTVGVITTQVFRSLNADGSTYKNTILRWCLNTNELNISTCEFWNSTSHVPTNECWTYFDCAPIPFYTNGCDFIIFSHPRWLAFTSYVANEQGLWAGVFEFEREDVQDTAAVNTPCWGWISSTLWMLGLSSYSAAVSPSKLICVPRTRSGMTGVNAAKSWAADYGVITYPTSISGSTPAFVYQLGNQNNRFISNAWDTTKRLALPIRPIHNYTNKFVEPKGKIFGLKVTAPAGSQMNKLQLTLDSNGNYSKLGSAKDNWLLDIQHKPYANDVNSWGAGNTTWVLNNINLGAQPIKMVSTGNAIYAISSNTLYKVLVASSTWSTVTVPVNTFSDIRYDGERYLYLCVATGLVRVDTTDDSSTFLATTTAGGVQTCIITDTYLICTPRTGNQTPILTRVLRSSFTVDSSVTAPTNSLPNASSILADGVVDDLGNVYLMVTGLGAAIGVILKVTPAGAVSTVTKTNNVPSGADNIAMYKIDSSNILIVEGGTTYYSVVNVSVFNFRTGIHTSLSNYGAGSSTTYQDRLSIFKINGVLVIGFSKCSGAPYIGVVNLGQETGVLPTPVTGVIYSALTNALYGPIISDGTRLVTSTSTGIRIHSKINTNFVNPNISVGQVVLPA